MTNGWNFQQDSVEAPREAASLPFAEDDDPAWILMPGDDPVVLLPDPPEVVREREAQARLERIRIEDQTRRAAFIDEYCYDGDAVMALARAGYSDADETMATAIIRVPEVARAIKERMQNMTPAEKRDWSERKLLSETLKYGKDRMPIAIIKALGEFARFAGVAPEEKKKADTNVHLHISQEDAEL
jgi:hypothetical protein